VAWRCLRAGARRRGGGMGRRGRPKGTNEARRSCVTVGPVDHSDKRERRAAAQ